MVNLLSLFLISRDCQDLFLKRNSNVILCTNGATICFKCHLKEKRKCSFENVLAEKIESSTSFK